MQNPLLSVQTSTPAAAPTKPSSNNAAASGPDSDFQRTLARQIEQRQASDSQADTQSQARALMQRQSQAQAQAQNRAQAQSTHQAAAPTPASQAKPSAPAPVAPAPAPAASAKPATTATNTDAADNASSQASAAAPAPDSNTVDAAPDATAAASATVDSTADQAKSDAQDALGGPVADMLALVASLNQAATASAAKAETAAPPDPTGKPAPAIDLGADTLKASDAATQAAATALQAAVGPPDQSKRDAGAQTAFADAVAAAGQKTDPSGTAALTTAKPGATQEGAAETAALQASHAKAQPDAAQLSAQKPADSAFKTAIATQTAIKDVQPDASILNAPVQQASLEIAQAASGIPTDKLNGRVGTPAWDRELGQKVVWMVAGGEQSASLTLNPPDLGPLQVVLNVSNDQATATFTSAQPEVRQALEAAMPRLREMMNEAGIQLANTSVSAGDPQQQRQAQQSSASSADGSKRNSGGDSNDNPVRAATSAPHKGKLGMVDTFA